MLAIEVEDLAKKFGNQTLHLSRQSMLFPLTSIAPLVFSTSQPPNLY
jgi:hypothetical protein